MVKARAVTVRAVEERAAVMVGEEREKAKASQQDKCGMPGMAWRKCILVRKRPTY